jgi:hypothetical protein
VYVPQPVPAGNLTVTLPCPGSVETLRLVGRARDCLPCDGPGAYEVEVAPRGWASSGLIGR